MPGPPQPCRYQQTGNTKVYETKSYVQQTYFPFHFTNTSSFYKQEMYDDDVSVKSQWRKCFKKTSQPLNPLHGPFKPSIQAKPTSALPLGVSDSHLGLSGAE